MTTYIVSGYMRTGTSGTMGALVAGGMEAHYDEEARHQMLDRWNDAVPVAGGYGAPNEMYYEPNANDFRDPQFPRMHEGKVIKVLFGGLRNLAVMDGGYRVVFMRRDVEEARQSQQAFFHRSEAPAWLSDPMEYESRMARAVERVSNRRDVLAVHEFRYVEDFIEQPLKMFTTLRDAGWPIDPEAAAAESDRSKYRFRLEDLVVGI